NSLTELPNVILKLLKFNTENIDNVGLIPNIQHEIELNKPKIIAMKPYRISPIMKERLKSEIEKLIRDKIIQRSYSEYASSAFPILKKNGEIRLVIDFRKLNRITKGDEYIFKKICDILVQLKGFTIYSKLDLKAGYYQITLEKENRKFTAFWIENIKYECFECLSGSSMPLNPSKEQWTKFSQNLNLLRFT
ncbi:Transposon Ty3-I Gag-Pol polyprotein, partial [Dictyocoela muelleri]